MSRGGPPRSPGIDRVRGLAPVVDDRARVLVLGSMPGAESLRRQQYYAYPRNHFWAIVDDVFGVPRDLPYPERLAGLAVAGVALWDVLGECTRRGSLDSAIERDTMAANDIPALLAGHPGIGVLLFNGKFAETVFRARLGTPTVPARRLPSTSPAHAARPYAEKLSAWREGFALR